MTNLTEHRVAYALGLLGAGLVLLGSLVSLFLGLVDLAVGRPLGALASGGTAIVLFVVGGLALLFAYLAHTEWTDRPLSGGVALVGLSLVGWLFLGLGANVLTIVGGLFVFLGGVLFAIEPAKRFVPTGAAA